MHNFDRYTKASVFCCNTCVPSIWVRLVRIYLILRSLLTCCKHIGLLFPSLWPLKAHLMTVTNSPVYLACFYATSIPPRAQWCHTFLQLPRFNVFTTPDTFNALGDFATLIFKCGDIEHSMWWYPPRAPGCHKLLYICISTFLSLVSPLLFLFSAF